jgi:Zn-dependent peptidase ImmA (M78 family)
LPIPIEMIIEQTYGLRIETRTIDEPPGVTILGALYQDEEVIALNQRHVDFFEQVIGPYEFTLAHELGHWLYDADPGQGTLFGAEAERFCYHRESAGLDDTTRIRETNANKVGAAILMPADLVRAVDEEQLIGGLRSFARQWGVSAEALEIRLEELGITGDPSPRGRLDWR